MVVRAGEFVKQYLDVTPDAVETAGVKLSIETVYRVSGPAVLSNDDRMFGDRIEVPTHNRYSFKQRSVSDATNALREFGLGPRSEEEFYYLEEGETYVIEYAEDITVPDGHIGLVFPEPDLLQSAVTLYTSIWGDDGEGHGEGALRVDSDVLIEDDTRIGQLVFFESDVVADEDLPALPE